MRSESLSCSNDPLDPSHGRLVTTVARLWRDRLPPGLSWADFIQEGELALIVARRDFDRSRGVKFSTFAYSRIQSHLHSVIRDAARAIRDRSLHPEIPDRSINLDAESIADLIWDEVDRLPKFDREALIRRFGLDGHGTQSQHLTAVSMGVGQLKISVSVRRSMEILKSRLAGEID